ncbi:MAG: D-aminoacylase, partial [Vicinamibacteria bacterium]|nr:D-aminoacylase [Vicinamibacteria bacterium]
MRAIALVVLALATLASAATEPPTEPPTAPYDLAIAGARIIDGSGNPWYRGDVYLRGDTIARIDTGRHNFPSKYTIDGQGLVLAPGFIDIHTHARRAIITIPTAENYARQGVTTLIEGPDGSSPIPLRAYLEQVGAVKTSVNFGAFIGQGSIRESVIGPN